jgi:hypothetical protein
MKRVLFFGTLMMLACDRPQCTNSNPVFDGNPPVSAIYKDELLKQIDAEGENNLSYWLERYEERDGKAYLQFSVQGDGLCAVADVLVKEWDEKIAGIKRTKGMSYSGAEIKGLKFTVKRDSAHTELVYQSLDAIID